MEMFVNTVNNDYDRKKDSKAVSTGLVNKTDT